MANTITKNITVAQSATVAGYDYEKRLAALTPEERSKYLALTEKVDVHNLTTVHEYGSELNSVVAENGERFLKSVKAGDGGEIVALTTELLSQLNMINIDEINTDTTWKNFLRKLPVVRKFVTTIENVKIKYNDIAQNVNAIAEKMGDAKLVALTDNSTLQEIFDNNVTYIDRLRELILGAKVLLEESEKKYKDMQEHINEYENYEISEMQDFIGSLQKRIADMQVTEAVLQQNLLQIRATQGNNLAIAEKSNNIVTNVIPLWKNQLSIAVIMNNQKKNVEAQQMLTETTNKILAENAKNLHTNSVAVAKANEESVISLETLKTTTNELIATIKEVERIHADGAHQRELIEKELHTMAVQLQDAITANGK
jgi:uncharacterized protein YaaN involved in tellurite resistance